MNTRAVIYLSLVLASAPVTGIAAPQTFTGSGSASTATFRMEGPWTLIWESSSEFPRLLHIEIHLYDAADNRHVGVVGMETGFTTAGQRIIREAGEYRLSVVGRNVDWTIRVEETNAEIAELLARNPDLSVVRLAASEVGLSRDLVERIVSWRAQDEESLLLKTADGRTLSASFAGNNRCPGLTATASVYFVTGDLNGDIFNAILLEDGTRCFLGGVASVE